MKSKNELYKEMLKKALLYTELDVVNEKADIVKAYVKTVVDEIYDTSCCTIYDCDPEMLKDYRMYIGILPKNKEIKSSSMGHFIGRLVHELVFDSTLVYYLEQVKETGKPVDLSTDIKKFPISAKTYNTIYRNVISNPKLFKLRPEEENNNTLNDIVNIKLLEFEKFGKNAGKNTISEIGSIMYATGHGHNSDIHKVQKEPRIDRVKTLSAEEIEHENLVKVLKELREEYSELQIKKAQLLRYEKQLENRIREVQGDLNSVTFIEDGKHVRK